MERGKKPNLKHFYGFGSTCFKLNDRKHKRKFNPKSDEGVFLGYSPNIRVYKVFNKRTKIIMELANVVVNDQGTIHTGPRSDESDLEGPLCEPGDDASANDTTPRNRNQRHRRCLTPC